MIKLFQDFVTVALREELGVSVERFGESEIATLDLTASGARGNVRLRPDLAWWDSSRCVFVGDVKYKSAEGERVPNSDLYQMLAYATAANLPGGLLVYAKGEAEVARYVIRHTGKVLEVDALDLSGSFECVLQRIRVLADRVRAFRAAAYTQTQPTGAIDRLTNIAATG